jgi:hypothetical protein
VSIVGELIYKTAKVDEGCEMSHGDSHLETNDELVERAQEVEQLFETSPLFWCQFFVVVSHSVLAD